MIDPLTALLAGGGLAGFAWWAMALPNKTNRLMRTLDLKNKDGKYPHLLDHDTSQRTDTFVLWVPDGIPFNQFIDPNNKVHQMLRQSLGDNHRVEVIPLTGHKLALRFILEELGNDYPYSPVPADKKNPLAFRLGESLDGPVTFNMGDSNPHICIAGANGSGKSVCARGFVTSMILHPIPTEIYLIDMKGGVEFKVFSRCKRVKGYARTIPEGLTILRELQEEMVRRNNLFYEAGETVNNIDRYNALGREKLPRCVLVIDEFAEFMARREKDAQFILKDIARRARSCGIHMIISTQRPDADVLDGQIRINVTGYICFMVSSVHNSTLILGHGGAELLPGHGRCILRVPAHKDREVQAYYLGEDECKDLVQPTYEEKPVLGPDTEGVYQCQSRRGISGH